MSGAVWLFCRASSRERAGGLIVLLVMASLVLAKVLTAIGGNACPAGLEFHVPPLGPPMESPRPGFREIAPVPFTALPREFSI